MFLYAIGKSKNIQAKCWHQYIDNNGIHVSIKFMKHIIEFIKENPKQDKGILRKYAESRKATIA